MNMVFFSVLEYEPEYCVYLNKVTDADFLLEAKLQV